jgi:glycosyltransferase involved in cell wall biosynthesis
MKLLMSAYACAPNRGSEYATGWNWTTEARQLGHEIWALVSTVHRDLITNACRVNPDLAGIRWIFPEVRGWPLKQGIEPRWERTYNLLWQRAALRQALPLHRRVRFDAVHHLTWGGIRAPTFLGALKIPLIIGPIGGGETSPASLRDELGFRGRLLEQIRDLSTSTITVNPLIRPGLNSAAVIFVYTKDTQNLFTGALHDKTVVFTPVAIPDLPAISVPRTRGGPPRFLCACRLLYWKGLHIAIRAFAEIVRQIPSAHFTIVGDGPERARLEADVRRHGLHGQVTFIARIPQRKLFVLYESHDLLLFPSLHDSGGYVVLEALSHGMPVVCLDLGGPRDIVTSSSGLVVKTGGRNTTQVARDMADKICRLLESPQRMAELSAGAISRAREFLVPRRVKEFYDLAATFVAPVSSHFLPNALPASCSDPDA